MRQQPQRGFTLIELMIVIAIIAVVAAIAIPNLIEARKGSNEAAAIGALRTITTAQELFKEDNGRDAASLPELARAGFIDPALGGGQKQGYHFELAPASEPSAGPFHWTARARPAGISRTGDRSFFVDETGVIRANPCPPGQHREYDPKQLKDVCVDDAEATASPGPLNNFEALVAIEELNSLSDGSAMGMAKDLLRDQAALVAFVEGLDADSNGLLSFGEVVDGDLVAAARRAASRLGIGGTFTPGSLGAIVLQRFQRRLAGELQLGIANETELPAVQTSCMTGFPAAFLEMSAGPGPRASLDSLQALLDELDTRPFPDGDMTGDLNQNARRKALLLRSAGEMFELLRFGRDAELRRELASLRNRVDDGAQPPDWVAGAQAAELRMRIDTTLRLLETLSRP